MNMILKTIGKALISPTAKLIGVHAIAIPAIGAFVSVGVTYLAQKMIINHEEKKAQKQAAKEDAINVEVVEN